MTTPQDPASWIPARYSPTLSGSEDFPSHADWLLRLVALVWRLPDGSPLVLDPWQAWLIRHILEVYPEGHPKAGRLRYRRVVVSMARQNGKSVLGAILGLYGLVRQSGALVIGIASSAEQARIVYSRLLAVISGNPSLARKFDKLTDTRGIRGRNGSRYEIKAAKSAAVQGLDVSVGLADELHIMPPALWTDLVNGTKATRGGIVVGITTAGDDSSELLKDLYKQIDEDRSERFGFFVWEAPEAHVPADDETLGQYLYAANPALVAGRLDLAEAIDSVRSMPEPDAIRYNLNKFVASSNAYLPAYRWAQRRGTLAAINRPVFAFDRTPDWGAATVAAAWKDETGRIHTQIVASLVKPSIEALEDLALKLNHHSPALYVADRYVLGPLLDRLKRRGLPVRGATLADNTSGAAMLYAKTVRGEIVHAGDEVLARQLPNTTRKNSGDGYRITRQPGTEIDAVIATMIAVYFADTTADMGMQLFI